MAARLSSPRSVDERRVAHQLRRRHGQLLGGELQQPLRQVGGGRHGTDPTQRRADRRRGRLGSRPWSSTSASRPRSRSSAPADSRTSCCARPPSRSTARPSRGPTSTPGRRRACWAWPVRGRTAGRRRPAAVQREVTAVMAGACGSTWFVATQHTMPVTTLAASRQRRAARAAAGGAVQRRAAVGRGLLAPAPARPAGGARHPGRRRLALRRRTCRG